MTLLPSPIPHPLDYSPWDLPGWMYDALDWVVGVEWPEGDERAVWDLADQWHAVAAALAGPHADAVAAAAEVRDGYGGVGAVATAFDGAWRRIAEGDDAPLPVLLLVSQDLGRLVEECGCDIEGAKLEVWIELGILVVELIGLAVATVLTAGAASPAAAAAITATRVIVQQIFKRLLGQLARKTLKQGLKEAGERAAKQVAEGGVRGLARRAAVGGLSEAAEESGVTLATQAYQNSTGRRHGLDVTDLTTSAVGGLAGGAVAPLAGMGRHATGRGARIGEHVGREMTGEVLAEQAASLATGQGPASVEEVARAAVSGARGSVTTQAGAALHARLDGRLSALAGLPSVPASPTDPSAGTGGAGAVVPTQRSGEPAVVGPVPVFDGEAPARGTGTAEPPSQGGAEAPVADPSRSSGAPPAAVGHSAPASPTLSSMADGPVAPVAGTGPVASIPVDGTGAPPLSTGHQPAAPHTGGSPALAGSAPAVSAGPSVSPSAGSAASTSVGPSVSPSAASAVTAGPPVQPGDPVSPTAPVSTGPSTPATAGTIPSVNAGPIPTATAAASPPVTAGPSPVVTGGPASQTSPVTQPLAGPTAAPVPPLARSGGAPPLPPPPPPVDAGFAPPLPPAPPPPLPPTDDPLVARTEALRPRTPEWYAARWAADQDAFERRRYRGHFEFQRNNHEENRRRDRAANLRYAADRAYDEARWLISESRRLGQAGYRAVSDQLFGEGRDRERWCHRQRDLAEAVLAGTAAPQVVTVAGEDFERINDDVGDLASGPVRTGDRSALTGDDHPPPIDRSRPYHRRGGLRPPLALHQRDVEQQVPRRPDGTVARTPDPRVGRWFGLLNDGGPQADPTRGINCVDCTLSLFETWVHGRPRVSAPRTFDAYALGDVTRPLNGEANGPGRIEDATGGRFQRLCEPPSGAAPTEYARMLDTGYRNLRDQLLVGGHGSFAFVINQWEGGGSHIWVALNQNGSILYLDPQSGEIADRPLGRHRGVPHPYNAVDVDVLVIGGDGAPMPLAGLRRGLFSQRPDLPAYPPATEHQGYGEPYLNRLHLLASPGSAEPPESFPDEARTGRDLRVVLDAIKGTQSAMDLRTSLQAAAPGLDETSIDDLADVLRDARMRSMFLAVEEKQSLYGQGFADGLLRRLILAPDLVQILRSAPELFTSLTARPVTMDNLARRPEAVTVLRAAVREVASRGVDAVNNEGLPLPRPVRLTESQMEASKRLRMAAHPAVQAGFDGARRHDASYRMSYVEGLLRDAQDAQRELNGVATRLAMGRGSPGWRAKPKELDRIRDKLVEYEGDASRLKDLAAAKIEFSSLEDIYVVLDEIGRDSDLMVVGIKDRFLKPQGSGYRDVLLNLRMANGHIAELRLHLASVEVVAKWEHSLYEVRRDLRALAEAQGRELTAAERAIRTELLRREQEVFWRSLGLEGE